MTAPATADGGTEGGGAQLAAGAGVADVTVLVGEGVCCD